MIRLISKVGFVQRPYNPGNPHMALETYYYDPASVKQQDSAVKWAHIVWTNHVNARYNENYWYPANVPATLPNTKPLPTIRSNTPMTGLILTDLEERGNGGRAYKVINPSDNSLFDIREDQMLQAILKYGIQPGGLIGGEWVWAINHTQSKCYLLDSKEYIQALQDNNLTTHPIT